VMRPVVPRLSAATTCRSNSPSKPLSTTSAAPPTSTRNVLGRIGTTLANTGAVGAGFAAFIQRYAADEDKPSRFATALTRC
jgi:hypothetical protein